MAVRTEGSYPELAEVYGDLVFDCGFEVISVPADLSAPVQETGIAGGQFLAARHHGSYDGLNETLDKFYWSALGAPGVELDDQPTFLHYLDDPEMSPEDELRTDLYLPVASGE